jgi:hypothetical protein
VIIFVIAFLNPPAPNEWWAPWLAAGFLLTLGSVGLCADERVTFTSDSVRKVGPFWRRRQMQWSEVVSVSFQKDGDVVLASVDGKRIRVTPDMVGVVEMPDILERHLPCGVLDECAFDLGTYRRFVGEPRTKRSN